MIWICELLFFENHTQNGILSHCGLVLRHEKQNLCLTFGIFNLILAQLTAISCLKSVIDLLKGFFLLKTQTAPLGRPNHIVQLRFGNLRVIRLPPQDLQYSFKDSIFCKIHFISHACMMKVSAFCFILVIRTCVNTNNQHFVMSQRSQILPPG